MTDHDTRSRFVAKRARACRLTGKSRQDPSFRQEVTFRDLEHIALDAHLAGVSWPTFWPTIEVDLRTLIPYDRGAYRRAYLHLLHIVTTGDRSGAEPIGSGASPWEIDDDA